MTDKEKIKAEIKLQIFNLETAEKEGILTEFGKGQLECLEGLLSFIDSLTEEPASDDLEEEINSYIGYSQEVDESTSVTMIRQAARHFAEWGRKQAEAELQAQSMALAHECPKDFAGSNLEEAARKAATWHSRIEGNKFFPNDYQKFIAGAQWQKQQMMKDSVDAEVNYWNQRGLSIRTDINVEDLANEGDRVKIIIIKEE